MVELVAPPVPTLKWLFIQCIAPKADGTPCGHFNRINVLKGLELTDLDFQTKVNERTTAAYRNFFKNHIHAQHEAEAQVVLQSMRRVEDYLLLKHMGNLLRSQAEDQNGNSISLEQFKEILKRMQKDGK